MRCMHRIYRCCSCGKLRHLMLVLVLSGRLVVEGAFLLLTCLVIRLAVAYSIYLLGGQATENYKYCKTVTM